MNTYKFILTDKPVRLISILAISGLILCSQVSCQSTAKWLPSWGIKPVPANGSTSDKTVSNDAPVKRSIFSGSAKNEVSPQSQPKETAASYIASTEPEAPIEVHRLPPITSEYPQSAPLNPVIGNQADTSDIKNFPPPAVPKFSGQSRTNRKTVHQVAYQENALPEDGQIILDNPEDAQYISAAQLGGTGYVNPGAANAQVYPSGVVVQPDNSSTAIPVQPSASNAAPSTRFISGNPVSFSGINSNQNSAWTPPGIVPANGGQWPQDEFIGDGGIGPQGVKVNNDFTVVGLKPENTIVHFDTIDGKVEVAASNRVEIYAPKFRSIRQLTNAGINEQVNAIVCVENKTVVASQDRNVGEMQSKQHYSVGQGISKTPAEQFAAKAGGSELSNRRQLMTIDNMFKAYESLQVIKTGEMDRSENAMLAESARRASVWKYNRQTQVLIDQQRVMATVQDEAPGIIYTMSKGTNNPQVRIIKIASVDSARPGDHVEFTIRFDNIGDEPVGNVTILDSLTGRLEYAQGTAQCSKKGNFMVEPNTAESLVLRWEIDQPLAPGEGGIIRFECIVR